MLRTLNKPPYQLWGLSFSICGLGRVRLPASWIGGKDGSVERHLAHSKSSPDATWGFY